MEAEDVFETVEYMLLDCPSRRFRVMDANTGQELDVVEIYESDWELILTIEPKETI